MIKTYFVCALLVFWPSTGGYSYVNNSDVFDYEGSCWANAKAWAQELQAQLPAAQNTLVFPLCLEIEDSRSL